MKDNARAQSLPPSAVVSLVALETSCGALGSTQLRNKNMETSKTYFFSSSCLCVSGVSGRAVGGEENDFFLKYGRHRLRRRRGRNCGPPRKIILHVPQALDPETQKKTPPFLRRVRRRRPPAGCSSNLWSSWDFKKKKAERETSRSRSAKCRGRGRRNRTSHLFHPQLPRYPPIRIRTFCSRGLSCGERQCRRSGEE